MTTDIKPFQIWEVNGRRARVTNVLMNAVELVFLDPPDTPELWRTITVDRSQLEADRQAYRFVE